MEKEPRRLKASKLMQGIAEVTLGASLISAMEAKQQCIVDGLDMEAGVFEEVIQINRSKLVELGLDPDQIIQDHIELHKSLER